MKKLGKKIVGFIKREWFLITMVLIIGALITLFEIFFK